MSQLHIDADDLACAFNRLIAQGMDEVLTGQLAAALEKNMAPHLDGLNDRLERIIELLEGMTKTCNQCGGSGFVDSAPGGNEVECPCCNASGVKLASTCCDWPVRSGFCTKCGEHV